MTALTTNPGRPSYFALAVWLVVTFAFAAIGAAGSATAPAFYAQLVRPEWAPPAWLFGPVWTILYTLMGIAAWRAWREPGAGRLTAALVYLSQLVLNSLWSWLFFAWHLGAKASLCIVVLWLAIAATMALFARRDRLAALLLVPYLAWVSFAGVLCYRIWQLNPGLLG
ncbi:TspO/MBR family protein [Pseudoduganella sp.]|uniref:TspO/MBR family protein n=1 Tax=Pseudoduganella sp. TaxID=1880898 RepID=UPI0035AE65EB